MRIGFLRMRRVAVRVCSIPLAILLAACASTNESAVAPGTPAMGAAKSEAAPPSSVVLDDEARQGPALPKAEIFAGDDSFANSTAPRRGAANAEGDVILDFAEAEVKDVIRTVLGDVLRVPYSIDPQVQGKVTIKTSKPLRKEDVIAALETALKVNGAVIVLADNVYNVVPATEAQRRTFTFIEFRST